MKKKIHRCPSCDSDELLVYESQSYNLNTGEFFCHSVKRHDSDAKVGCLCCEWIGRRDDFEEDEE